MTRLDQALDPFRPWNDLERAALRRLRAQGVAYVDIGAHLGRHAGQCQYQAERMGLPRIRREAFVRADGPQGGTAA